MKNTRDVTEVIVTIQDGRIMVGNSNKKKAAVGRQTSGTRNLLLVVEFC
jgi:hypothetical protein